MMHRHTILSAAFLVSLTVACSDKSPPPTPPATAPVADVSAANEERTDPNVTRARLNANGVAGQYSAHFDAEKLVRIDERRQSPSGVALEGEYAFQGARLLHYRGAKITEDAALDLEFDLQGVLRSGLGPDVSAADVDAIRNRAQLLRSHALAQRATRAHSNY